eukprot:scaffold200117_cov32-Prasinocladus_malaysianus.AAC.1
MIPSAPVLKARKLIIVDDADQNTTIRGFKSIIIAKFCSRQQSGHVAQTQINAGEGCAEYSITTVTMLLAFQTVKQR